MSQLNLLTAGELAQQLKCSVPAIRLWTRRGMPSHRFGRLVRYEPDSVLAWFALRSRPANARNAAPPSPAQ